MVTLLKPNTDGKGYTPVLDSPGVETDIAMEKKQITDNEFDVNVEVDIDAGMAGIIPLPFGSASPHLGISNDLVATHATTKVIRYPAILKSETTFKDGMKSKVEYLAFNASTGQPIITRTYDGYYKLGVSANERTGEIYQFSVPAEWKYPEMGQKSKDPTNTNQLSEQTMAITTYGTPPVSGWLNGDPIGNVLDVSVTTYDRNWQSSWTDKKIKADYSIADDAVVDKLNKIWRQKASYIYKTTNDAAEMASNNNKSVFERGFYTIPAIFNWSNPASQANWIKLTEVKKYSPNGNPLEEVDVMNIPSTVVYAPQYGNNLPVMVAQNAEYNDIYFNDFEGNNTDATSVAAHSGKQSVLYHDNISLVDNCYVTKHLSKKGGVLKFWTSALPVGVLDQLAINVNSNAISFEKVAQSGNWSLYACKIEGNNFPALNGSFTISLTGYSGTEPFYIDDVRFQPMDAQATCFVYDKQTFKLLTQFDDQHFGAYYKYNDEGVLTHKIVETERGLKTIQETQYNIPKTNRPLN
jgi:hypothetical protein